MLRKFFVLVALIGAAACSSPLGLDHTPDPGTHVPDPNTHTPDPGSHTPDPGT